MKIYDTIPGETVPPFVEVFEEPKHIKFDQGDFYVYAQDPLIELPPEHHPHAYYSYVDVRQLTLRGARRPHVTSVTGKVGEQIVYMESISNHTKLLGVNLSLAPYGFELAGQSLRALIHTRRAHAEVRKVLGGLKQPDVSLQ